MVVDWFPFCGSLLPLTPLVSSCGLALGSRVIPQRLVLRKPGSSSKEVALLWVVGFWEATRYLEFTCGNSMRVRIGLLHSIARGLVPGFTNREEV